MSGAWHLSARARLRFWNAWLRAGGSLHYVVLP
jgi:hypothetical protein